MNKRFVSDEMMKDFLSKARKVKKRSDLQFNFFDSFPLSYIVPVSMYDDFFTISHKFYDEKGHGYNGIMQEIADRIEISNVTGRALVVRDFLKHRDDVTDLFDPTIGKALEKKTGCGDWFANPAWTTIDKMVTGAKKRQRLLRWDYDFVPEDKAMNGKKDVCKGLKKKEQKVLQERVNPKKVGTAYPVSIHIETTYKRFFEYLSLYPAGIETFFKCSTRSAGYTDKAGKESTSGTVIWQLQTLKNSKKKIAFLEHFNTWEETGLTIEEYKKEKEESDE